MWDDVPHMSNLEWSACARCQPNKLNGLVANPGWVHQVASFHTPHIYANWESRQGPRPSRASENPSERMTSSLYLLSLLHSYQRLSRNTVWGFVNGLRAKTPVPLSKANFKSVFLFVLIVVFAFEIMLSRRCWNLKASHWTFLYSVAWVCAFFTSSAHWILFWGCRAATSLFTLFFMHPCSIWLHTNVRHGLCNYRKLSSFCKDEHMQS